MKLASIAAICALFVGPALAADLPTRKGPPEAPVVDTAYNWTGGFIGANAYWSENRSSFSVYPGPLRTNLNGLLLARGSDRSDTFHGGGQFGYRYMFPSRIVIGGVISVDAGTDSTTRSATATTKSTNGISGTGLAQLGYAFGGVMPYIDGGFAWQGSDVSRTPINNAFTDKTGYTRTGWDIGGGLAVHVWQGWEVFAQYDHREYGRATWFYQLANLTVKSNLITDSVTVGVNYKF